MSEVDHAQAGAHLRPLPKCRVCGNAAVAALYSGRNDHMADYCARHAAPALKLYQESGRLT